MRRGYGRRRVGRAVTAREIFARYDKPRSEWERLIAEWIFDARDRALLSLRLLDGLTIDQLAEKLDMPVDTVKRRVRRAQRRLFEKAGA